MPTEIKRIVREEIASAAEQLGRHGQADRDTAIHEARKNVKKIRGVLRLVQPELGETYRAENLRLRDAGRKLSEFRDACAMLEIFDELVERYRNKLEEGQLDSIRRGLVERKQQIGQQADIEGVLRRMPAEWRRSARRVAAWPLKTDGFAAIAMGLEATFRRGRKALRRARSHPVSENFHEWRKRVKEHWYHVRLLEGYWSGGMQAYEESLKNLETALGEDHNLVLLQQKVQAEQAFYGNGADIDLFFRLTEKYHKELRAKALKSGERIYEEKPRRFTRRMQRLWEAEEGPRRRTPLPRRKA